jgi:hypothetical protein
VELDLAGRPGRAFHFRDTVRPESMDPLVIFRDRAAQLFWQRIDDSRVSGRPTGRLIESEKAHVGVRLPEMHLGTTRRLWRKRSPLVQAFITSGAGKEHHAVAGPGQPRILARPTSTASSYSTRGS